MLRIVVGLNPPPLGKSLDPPLGLNKCHRLAIVVSSNLINLINAHYLHYKPARVARREQCALTKLDELLSTARSCGKQKWHSFASSLD